MIDSKDKKEKKQLIAGGLLEALRKNVSFLSKIPLFLALPITIALALGITLSPVLFTIILASLPIIIIAATIIGFVNFVINFRNAKKRCEHNLIPELEQDIHEKKELLKKLHAEINELYKKINHDKSKELELFKVLAELEAKNKAAPKPGKLQKVLSNLSPSIELFFKYFVIIPGSIGAFGGVLFLVASSLGVNVFQMGSIVTFMSLTGIGGLVAFGIVIGISSLAMIALFIYKAKFEEKFNAEHKKIHEQELRLLEQKINLEKDIEKCLKLKCSLEDLDTSHRNTPPPELIDPQRKNLKKPSGKQPFYATKKSKSYKISGAILAAINESVFMYSKYITFTGLVIVVLGGLGVTFTPMIFIGLTVILTVFTLIMAGIGVGKFLGALNAVNNLADDNVLKHLRQNCETCLPEQASPVARTAKQSNHIKFERFLENIDKQQGILGFLINKLRIKKIIISLADNFPSLKNNFRTIEAAVRYTYLFAVALGAVTSGTILAAGISGIGVTGLGAILSASVLSGFGIPIVAAAVLGLTAILAVSLIIYKKYYENPLSKAQRDAANEKTKLVSAQYAALRSQEQPNDLDSKDHVVRSPIRQSVFNPNEQSQFSSGTNSPKLVEVMR